MTTSIKYKGPSIHERRLTRADFVKAEVDFETGEKFPDLVWKAGSDRRRQYLPDDLSTKAREQILDILNGDPHFEVNDDDGNGSEADPNADKVNPDGSSAADGSGGSKVLAEAIGTQRGSTDTASSGSTVGGSTTPSPSAGSTGGRTSTTGGSTASS